MGRGGVTLLSPDTHHPFSRLILGQIFHDDITVYSPPPWLFNPFSNTSAGVFKQSVGARNRAGIGLWFRPARQRT